LAGRWLDARTAAQQLGQFHVITAWNPGHERPGDDANAAANAALRVDLEALGCSWCAARFPETPVWDSRAQCTTP
jgi:hypothetical protein